MTEAAGMVLCFSVEQAAQRGLLDQARAHAAGLDAQLGLVSLGASQPDGLEELGRFGADIVYSVSDASLGVVNSDVYTAALVQVIERLKPSLVLIAGSGQGLDIAATAAQRMGASCINDLMRVERGDGGLLVTGSLYSGRAKATYAIDRGPVFATTIPVMDLEEGQSEGVAAMEEISVALQPPAVEVVDVRPKEVSDRGLAKAEVIVDFGQGVAAREDIALIERFAEALGAQVGCSRPISSELGWMPDFIGLSGMRVSPELCFCVGIAGAVQHMVGLRDAKVIVAINSDPDAGIFTQADYGVVGDLYEVIPAIMDALH